MQQKSLEGGNALGPVEQALEKLVQEKDGELIVNWKHFHELNNNNDEINTEAYQAAVNKLEELNILSVESNNNYEIIGCEIVLNPRWHIFRLYFTRETDVKAYKEAVYKNAQYSVGIQQIRVIK